MLIVRMNRIAGPIIIQTTLPMGAAPDLEFRGTTFTERRAEHQPGTGEKRESNAENASQGLNELPAAAVGDEELQKKLVLRSRIDRGIATHDFVTLTQPAKLDKPGRLPSSARSPEKRKAHESELVGFRLRSLNQRSCEHSD
jgi:hypothetical protein